MIDLNPYRISPGSQIDLHEISTRENGGLKKKEGKKAIRKLIKRLVALQELLYAQKMAFPKQNPKFPHSE